MAIAKFEMPELDPSVVGDRTNQAAGALICAASTGRILLQLRGEGGDAPGVWGQFGGGMERGETREAAVQRELEEETGYTGPIFIRAMKANTDKGFTYHNHVAVVPEEFTPVTNEESAGHVWCKVDAWPVPLHPGLEKLLRDPTSLTILYDTVARRKYLVEFCRRYGSTHVPQYAVRNIE